MGNSRYFDMRFADRPAFRLRLTCANLRCPKMGQQRDYSGTSDPISGGGESYVPEKLQHLDGLVVNGRRRDHTPNNVGVEEVAYLK